MRIEQEHCVRAAKSLFLTLLLAAGLSACSSDKEEPTAGEPASSETGPDSVAETPAIEDVLPVSYREMWAPWVGDFDGMVERRVIRVVTPYGGYMYYFEDGEPKGAAWELASRLETYLNEELGRRSIRVFVVVIPLSRDRLIPALLEGNADVIAADLTITGMRSERVAFTRPLLKDINEVLVTSADIDDIATLDDIAGREIHVRRSSSYFEHLEQLSASMQERDLEPPTIVELDELLETEDILDMLNVGMIDMTVLDDYKAEFWATVFPGIAVRDDLIVNEGGSIAWVTRKDSPGIMNRLNAFLARYGRGTLVGN
ncbi:MAG: transporter substrate-binding domain-containing protein, partial [Woeseiaceae bacterium]|nr:transporter substrate-binding domain-containing protein [Woeseiaceae bacterium]